MIPQKNTDLISMGLNLLLLIKKSHMCQCMVILLIVQVIIIDQIVQVVLINQIAQVLLIQVQGVVLHGQMKVPRAVPDISAKLYVV